MAAGLPMILIKPIPGQEVRNSDFLLEEGAAVRCNYDTTVGYKIDSLLDSPERIRQMAASARRLGPAASRAADRCYDHGPVPNHRCGSATTPNARSSQPASRARPRSTWTPTAACTP